METSSETPGIIPSLKKLLQIVLTTAANRLELAAVETQEEAARWVESLILVAALAVLGGLTLAMISLTIVLTFWEEHRLAAMLGLSILYLLAFLGTVWRLRWRFKNWDSFAATLAELKKDKACLESSTNYDSERRP
jgi:uncharacterized membrane protein YqjE